MPIIDFTKILIRAFEITKNHKRLWFFGLLLTGASPIALTHYADAGKVLENLLNNPGLFFRVSFILLLVSFVALCAMNIGRLNFILTLSEILKIEEHKNIAQRKLFGREALRVIAVSTTTVLLMAFIGTVLISPYFWFLSLADLAKHMLPLGVSLAVGLGFIISCINIFACLFVIYYKRTVRESLSLSVDLLKTKWVDLLVIGGALLVTHSVVFFCAKTIALISTYIMSLSIKPLLTMTIVSSQQVGLIDQGSQAIIFWLSAAIYSVFFNTVIVSAFFEIVKDIENPEFAKRPVLQIESS